VNNDQFHVLNMTSLKKVITITSHAGPGLVTKASRPTYKKVG